MTLIRKRIVSKSTQNRAVLLSRNHEYLCRTTVVASVATQSKLGLLRRFAPRNDNVVHIYQKNA